MRGHSFSSHLKAKKSKNSRRNLKKRIELTGFYAKKIRKALGLRKAK